ncbi:MAG: DUF763 domain-containing protein [Candidatus Bilamarchaeum sp.]
MNSIDLPLHPGKCPPWLFRRMKQLSGLMCQIILRDYGTVELLSRLSDPMFFQAFSCTIGFDWHSSGTTTTTCGAIKESLGELECGLRVCGGKGQAAALTQVELDQAGADFSFSDSRLLGLKKASKLSAKVDQSCIQDGYILYHHSFFVDEKGNWVVVQQGLNHSNKYARRYHWMNNFVFVDSPQQKIAGTQHEDVLHLVSKSSDQVRKISLDIIKDNPARLRKYFDGQTTLFDEDHSVLPAHHEIRECNITKKDWEYLQKVYEIQPQNYEQLVSLAGMGGRKLRALALVSKILHGTELDWKDPVKYSFAHGGKDGIPFPVDKHAYQNTIDFLRDIIHQTEGMKSYEKARVLKALSVV